MVNVVGFVMKVPLQQLILNFLHQVFYFFFPRFFFVVFSRKIHLSGVVATLGGRALCRDYMRNHCRRGVECPYFHCRGGERYSFFFFFFFF